MTIRFNMVKMEKTLHPMKDLLGKSFYRSLIGGKLDGTINFEDQLRDGEFDKLKNI